MLKMVLGSAVLALSLMAQQAFAHDHDHDHGGFPEGTLLALEGEDASTKSACMIFVTEVGYTGSEQTPDQWYAVIATSYSHGHVAASPITVKIHPERAGVLFGTGANGQDQIAVFLNPQDIDLKNINSFNLKWLHGDHFHTNRCVNMQVHAH
ncbi:hypothetical protein [Bdellovibrio sp. HCB288]|uniref:hypothetical protein n=1 Tax=Bdellovibrio sp. HCB288 TaxID=3394355 RepID=UPI0039B4262C